MDFDDFENKLRDKLIADISEPMDIRAYPDSFENYIGQLKHINGAILIAWQGGFWEPPEGNNQKTLTQNCTYNWQFSVLKKNLSRKKNQSGAYDVIEEIRQILSGFTPAGFDDSSVMWPVDAGFLERRNGFYVYQITMSHQIEESEE